MPHAAGMDRDRADELAFLMRLQWRLLAAEREAARNPGNVILWRRVTDADQTLRHAVETAKRGCDPRPE